VVHCNKTECLVASLVLAVTNNIASPVMSYCEHNMLNPWCDLIHCDILHNNLAVHECISWSFTSWLFTSTSAGIHKLVVCSQSPLIQQLL